MPTHAAADLEPVVAAWRDWLRSERRVAVLTQSGYDEDLGAFLGFMAGHRGGPVGLGDLASMRLADFRSWLAWRHQQNYARTSTAHGRHGPRGRGSRVVLLIPPGEPGAEIGKAHGG